MTEVATLLGAIASVLWPIPFFVVAWWIRGLVPSIVPRLRSMKVAELLHVDLAPQEKLAAKLEEKLEQPATAPALPPAPNVDETAGAVRTARLVRLATAARLFDLGVLRIAENHSFAGSDPADARFFLVEQRLLNGEIGAHAQRVAEVLHNTSEQPQANLSDAAVDDAAGLASDALVLVARTVYGIRPVAW